jgi:hypothetical protein
VAAVVCVTTTTGALAAQARASGDPHAWVGMRKVSYTSARAPFGIDLSSQVGLASYDVRRANSSMRAPHRTAWKYPPKLQGLPVHGTDTSRRLTLSISHGRVWCVSVRAHDVTGKAGPWSDDTCIIRALDDAALSHHGHTRVVRDRRYWGGRATELDRRARMVLRGVPTGSRILVIVTELNQNILRLNGRCLRFTVPARHGVLDYSDGGRFGPTRYTQIIGAARPSGRRGPIVFHGGFPGQHPRWSSPFEGIVIQPRWV